MNPAAVLAFFTSGWGRWLAAAGVGALIVAGAVIYHGRAVSAYGAAQRGAEAAVWKAAAAAAEISWMRQRDAAALAAYKAGVKDAQARAADTVEREAETEIVIREVVKNVPASCALDPASAERLNGLRRNPG